MESVTSWAHTADPTLALRFCSDDCCWGSYLGMGMGMGMLLVLASFTLPVIRTLRISSATLHVYSFPYWEEALSRWLIQVDESESCVFHEPTSPVPESTKASYTQGEELACLFLLQLRHAQGSSVGTSTCSVAVSLCSVCDDLVLVHLWFLRTSQSLLLSLGWTAEVSPVVAYSFSSASVGDDAGGPLCSGIMHTQRCASQTPFRAASLQELWLADDLQLFVPLGQPEVMLRAASRSWLREEGPNNLCPRPVVSCGQALLWSAPFGLKEALSICVMRGCFPLPNPAPLPFLS